MQSDNNLIQMTKEIPEQDDSPSINHQSNETIVQVRPEQHEEDDLITRSQAKRLLAKLKTPGTIVFDFEGVNTIGQAFADEVFRVFANQHPELKFLIINASVGVKKMISRATAA